MRTVRRVLVIIAVPIVVVAAVVLVQLDRRVRAYLAGPALGAVRIYAAPTACRAAVLAAEDRRFFRHPGIDPTAVARALLTDLRAGGRRQGGSTLSQQLAKNVFLTPRRTLSRKVREAMLALLLEAHASKEEILRRYLASVYLGEDGAVPIHGFAEAAEAYFAKPLGDLGPAECALLAGIIRSPNGLAPRQHGPEALARRNRVLATMIEDGALDAGRDDGSSPLDRAVRARRQPGSAFKPFVYLAALDPARSPNGGARTVVSPLEDTPLEVPAGAHVWRPVNYDGVFHGSVPVEDALAESLNAATARLALDVGLEAVAGAATDLGIGGPLPLVPSLALGVAETSLLDLTAAYGVFASGGVKRTPDLVVAITSSAGEPLYAAPGA